MTFHISIALANACISLFLKAQLEEAKKAAQIRPEIIRAETVTTTEAAMDHAEPFGNKPGN